MKKIILCLILFLQAVSASKEDLHQFTLPNGTDVIVYENFVSPVILVGFIFDTGTVDVPKEKFGLAELAISNVVNKKACNELQNTGISYHVFVNREYSEIAATVSPKEIKDFFRLMQRNLANFSVHNLDQQKSKILLREKLKFYTYERDMENLIFAPAHIRKKNTCEMFNEAAFNSITVDELRDFYRNVFSKCHLSVIICGAIGYKSAKNMLSSSIGMLPSKNKMNESVCERQVPQNVFAENKFLMPSLHFVYNVPKNIDSKIKEKAMRVFSHEMFRFLSVSNTAVTHCGVRNLTIRGDNLLDVHLIPRFDVSLDSLEKLYEAFSRHLRYTLPSEEEISSIISDIKNSNCFTRNDLSEMYQYIKTQVVSSRDVQNVFCEEDEKIDGEQTLKFFKEILFTNFLYKVRTQYGADI